MFLHSGVLGHNLLSRYLSLIRKRLNEENFPSNSDKKELYFKTLFEQANDMILIHETMKGTMESAIIDANEKTCEILGYSKEELQNMTISDLDASKIWDKDRLNIRNEIITKGSSTYERKIVCKDGTEIPVEISSHKILLDDGESQTISILRDISSWKNALSKLKESEFALNERIKELKGLYSTSNLFQDVNKDYSTIFQEFLAIIPPSYQYPEKTTARLVLDNKEYKLPNFKETALVQTANLVISEKLRGKIEVFLLNETEDKELDFLDEEQDLLDSLAIEVSEYVERKEYRQIVLEQLSENELYLKIITHDINNILSAIKGYLYLIFEHSFPPEHKKYLHRIRSRVIHAETILNNIVVILQKKNRLSLKKAPIPIDLSDGVKHAKKTIEELYFGQNISFKIKKIPEDVRINADSLFEHVLINLFSNAVIHNDNTQKIIEVGYKRVSDEKCILSIADNASGIKPEERNKIFNLFEESQKSDWNSQLGLNIAKTLVDSYGGKIWIESREEEAYTKGSVFKIELQLAKKKR